MDLDKLKDYISGFRELKNPIAFSVGAVVLENVDLRMQILDFLKKEKFAVIEGEKSNNILRDIMDGVYDEEIVVLNLEDKLSKDNALGIKELVMNKIPNMKFKSKSRLIFLLSGEVYEELGLDKIISSVCRVS